MKTNNKNPNGEADRRDPWVSRPHTPERQRQGRGPAIGFSPTASSLAVVSTQRDLLFRPHPVMVLHGRNKHGNSSPTTMVDDGDGMAVHQPTLARAWQCDGFLGFGEVQQSIWRYLGLGGSYG